MIFKWENVFAAIQWVVLVVLLANMFVLTLYHLGVISILGFDLEFTY